MAVWGRRYPLAVYLLNGVPRVSICVSGLLTYLGIYGNSQGLRPDRNPPHTIFQTPYPIPGDSTWLFHNTYDRHHIPLLALQRSSSPSPMDPLNLDLNLLYRGYENCQSGTP